MKNLKSNKAITLVALVITIIILLILAMVSINLVLNEGIIKRAQNAVNAYNSAQTNELKQLNYIENKVGKYDAGNWWEPTTEEKEVLKEHIENGNATIGMVYKTKVNQETGETEIDSGVQIVATMDGNEEAFMLMLLKIVNEDLYEYYYMPINDIGVEFAKYDEKYWSDQLKEECPNTDYKIGKWYKTASSSHYYKVEEYSGPALISLDDYTNKEIYCQSYFDRIVNYSFE